jgi:hypothetical protein
LEADPSAEQALSQLQLGVEVAQPPLLGALGASVVDRLVIVYLPEEAVTLVPGREGSGRVWQVGKFRQRPESRLFAS